MGSGVGRVATALSIAYDGPALDGGEMSIRELAPALLAFADVVASANAVVNPGFEKPRVAIKAEPRQGSFIIDLIVADPSLLAKVRDLFASDNATAVSNAGTLLTWIALTIRSIKRQGGQDPVEQVELDNRVRLTFPDGTVLEVPLEVSQLWVDQAFRRAMRSVVEPVQANEGVDSFEIRGSEAKQSVSINTEEATYFRRLPGTVDRVITDTEYESTVRPVTLAFEDGLKWRLADEGGTFYAAIHDLDFVARVNEDRESFSSGDRFRVRIRLQQRLENGSLISDRTVIRVLEHIRANPPVQGLIPLSDED